MHLEFDHISLELGKKRILDDVTFDVRDGEFVSILGESGAGKSTTLKIIAGLLVQDAGQVRFDGQAVDDLPAHKRGCAIVFQDIRLFPNMNVRDNVAFPLKMRHVAKAERARAADELLEAVQLGGMGDRRTSQLSGGQQQRVALARALAAKPRAMLLDEPFSGLDEQLRDDMRRLVADLHARFGMTTLMVTHDPDEALVMSDRILYLGEGRLLQEGAPADLLLHPAHDAVSACFGDTSAIRGTVGEGCFHAGKLSLEAPEVDDGPAVLVRVKDGGVFVHSLGDAQRFSVDADSAGAGTAR